VRLFLTSSAKAQSSEIWKKTKHKRVIKEEKTDGLKNSLTPAADLDI